MVSVIVAVAQNGVIGCANKLIWHIGEDLRRFRDITTGHPVIMGRKTFESIGKPLPNRTNVVVSRNSDYRAEGVLTANSLEAAIEMFSPQEEVFVIGGGEIYAQAMPRANKLYLTVVGHNYVGDTIFPEWEAAQWSKGSAQGWVETSREEFTRGAKFEYPFSFIEFKKEI